MRNEIVVQKMRIYIERALGYCSGYDYKEFSEDMKLIDACVFNLSQIGELCKLIDAEYEAKHPQIPWRQMYGLRNRIVHDYEGVNLQLIWEIITEDLPGLKQELDKLSKSSNQKKDPALKNGKESQDQANTKTLEEPAEIEKDPDGSRSCG